MLRRLVLVLAAAALLLAGWTTAAAADDTLTRVACESGDAPHCVVEAGTPAQAAPAGSVNEQTDAGSQVCRGMSDEVVPCSDPLWGTIGSDGCYWKPNTEYRPPAWVETPSGAGAWFDVHCFGRAGSAFPGTGTSMQWVAAGEVPPLAVPPEVLAAQARNRLNLAGPSILTSPPGVQLVGVPTWMWLDASAWGQRSATAAVPGVSVTATAVPVSASWVMGDGSTIECSGPGTPWQAGTDPAMDSPDCGHTYRESSVRGAGARFSVTATVTWSVSWVGGGEMGTLPALATTSSTSVAVAESQALNTAVVAGS